MSLGPLMISLEGLTVEPRELKWLESPLVGGVILFARNFSSREQVQALVEEIHAVRKPPLLVAVDQEGGRVQRFGEPFLRLPPARVIGHVYDEDPDAGRRAARAVAAAMASELLSIGVDMSFAPVVELDLGLAEVIGDRAFHRSGEVVTRLARDFCAACQAVGMEPTAKHFPTHAGAKTDSHTEIAVDRRDYGQLFDDLQPYRELIDSGLHSIMVAHVIFPEFDPLPASLSRWWIESQLRGELGFKGAVISDDMSMVGASAGGDLSQRVIKSLEAGCDMVLVCNVPDRIPEVLSALEGYVDPAAQLRLMRLRGRAGSSWEALHASGEWAENRACVQALMDRPKLELEG